MATSEIQDKIRHLVQTSPEDHGFQRTRWILRHLLAVLAQYMAERGEQLRSLSLPALSKMLRRLHIRYRRGRPYVHSPDRDYERKRHRAEHLLQEAKIGKVILYYLDEVTYHRQPTVAKAYHPSDAGQPLARLGYASDSSFRVAALVNACTGKVIYAMRSRISIATLRTLFITLCAAHPGEQVHVVTDNWPLHYHADLLAALIEQPCHSEFHRPQSWSDTPKEKAPRLALPIILAPLPTYASWLNPIEKLWGKSRREVTHLHRFEDDVPAYKARMQAFFDQFQLGSQDLLKTIGLLSD